MGVWNDLLASFAASKAPTKSVFILDQLYLDEESFLTPTLRNPKANEFGVGYTYIQFKDEYGELLSTLQIYTLPGDYKERHNPLIQTVLKSLDLLNSLIIPLLDYTETPHCWISSLKSWISIIDEILPIAGKETDSNKTEIKDELSTITLSVNVLIAVVNTETRPDWEYSNFEFIQVILRLLSLIHGFNLIYTSLLRKDSRISQLVSSILKIDITGKVLPKLEPNLIDHTEIFVPIGIDTIGKIRTINDDINPNEILPKYDFLKKPEDDELVKYYEDIIPKPPQKKQVVSNGDDEDEKSTTAQADISYQEFLTRLYDKRNNSQEAHLRSFIENVKS
ncbi:Cytoplasmic dynein 1 light intermediate chain 1 [Wickerhamomyces ciferrii]|uniref:Cytoplasmic dynein 1 light intermediate chain 1 n=1 Tax=Wickerhamomyces ciferrii (strain ATCC 14091 / BCRC 22168 / CBS 111 / JCM 3599 / NBRC 0793 / NRRL Y-1031 F-60-10) TaxID=1206466 RepID=K0KZN1_WICCF|nr:Cytoplasmic dynein 1 light intermediate chain 1 [Wickerhamomyces ciferrii]CCH46774.1 Cytoplasmic dynein 1 light intermediate chain 1 [Wickerhamomyces ciferrii]